MCLQLCNGYTLTLSEQKLIVDIIFRLVSMNVWCTHMCVYNIFDFEGENFVFSCLKSEMEKPVSYFWVKMIKLCASQYSFYLAAKHWSWTVSCRQQPVTNDWNQIRWRWTHRTEAYSLTLATTNKSNCSSAAFLRSQQSLHSICNSRETIS